MVQIIHKNKIAEAGNLKFFISHMVQIIQLFILFPSYNFANFISHMVQIIHTQCTFLVNLVNLVFISHMVQIILKASFLLA